MSVPPLPAPSVAAEGTAEPTSAGYEPGIDGLRAVAVTAVLLFHAGFVWAKGGFLGVSLFFTLSGFLITRLLLGEFDRTRRIRLGRFVARRVRRLAPASHVCLLLIAAGATLFAASGRPLQLRGDLLAALAYVANWRFLFSHQSYADLFVGGPSPVLHFWSLAIEEQFYLVYPAVIAGAALVGRRLRRSWLPAAAICVLATASIVVALLNTDHDRGYYATHLRAAELLVGALAAVLLRRVGTAGLRRWSRVWAVAGLLAVMAFGVLVVIVPQSSTWLTRGGFAGLAVVWSLTIVGVLVPGPLRRVLSLPPLVHVGRLSFSLYLYHWPVFLILAPDRVGLDGVALFGVRVAVAFAAASLSYHVVEHPIRIRRVRLAAWRGALAYTVIVAAVASVALVRLQPGPFTTFDAMLNAPDGVVSFDPGAATTTAPPPPPKVVVVVGSDPLVLGRVQQQAAIAGAEVENLTDTGCSVLEPSHPCASPAERISQYLRSGAAPDLVVLALGGADHDWVAARLMHALSISQQASLDESVQIEREMSFLRDVREAVPVATPVQVIDSHPVPAGSVDPLPHFLEEAVLASPNTVDVHFDDIHPEMYAATAPPSPSRHKVMVIGDSSSYGVAIDLNQVAGDRLEVMWAGFRNCPLAPVVEIHWWAGAQWTLEDCLAKQAEWPGLIQEFRPDILLVVLSLPEHADQRYAGDDTWYHVGDARFIQEHDAALEKLLAEVSPYGTQVLVSDSNHIGSAERVDAWNAYIATWAARFPQVHIVPLGAAADAAEAAAGHSLRPDGIHLDDATLLQMVSGVFVPAVDEALTRSPG